MDKSINDLFEIIEKTKVEINEKRKKKNQSIKDFLIECETESRKLKRFKELVYK